MNQVAEYVFNFKDEHMFDSENWIDLLRQDSLMQPLNINVYKNYMIIKYRSLIDSFDDADFWDKNNGFYKQCRSLVLDYVNEEVVLWPYDKFFNINEREESSYENVVDRINHGENVFFTEKLDGSYIAARYYNGEYVLSSSGNLNPETYHVYLGYDYLQRGLTLDMLRDNPDITFIFEMISDRDQHVVNYRDKKGYDYGLYLTGMVDSNTGENYSPDIVKFVGEEYHQPTPAIYDMSLDEVLGSLDTKSGDEAEGFVLFVDGYRAKIKYNDYVRVHHTIQNINSIKATVEAIRGDYFDDFISKIPAGYRSIIDGYLDKILEYVSNCNDKVENYLKIAKNECADYNDRKTFMIWVNENVDKDYSAWVRNTYLGRKNDYLKSYK